MLFENASFSVILQFSAGNENEVEFDVFSRHFAHFLVHFLFYGWFCAIFSRQWFVLEPLLSIQIKPF